MLFIRLNSRNNLLGTSRSASCTTPAHVICLDTHKVSHSIIFPCAPFPELIAALQVPVLTGARYVVYCSRGPERGAFGLWPRGRYGR